MNWIYEERCSGIAITDGKEDETIIAMIIPDNDEDECSDIQEANAKLIAAAPELLDELQKAHNFINVFLKKMPEGLIPSDWTDAMFAGIKSIESAIKKATV